MSESTLERLKVKAAEEADGVKEAVKEAVEELKGSSTREYTIITKYEIVEKVVAGSPKAAIDSLPKGEGKYAAIPSRNFSEFTLATEEKTVVTVTPA